jgi:protease-4
VGVITAGEDRRSVRGFRSAGARAVSELLGALRGNRRVKAVVLRVESPGGGAVASDRIRRQLELTAKEKPVVVSMGDVAASGGYYVATAADAVVAEGSTLTGSIGVIGGKFVVRRLLDRLGIHRETRSAGANAGFYSPLRSFTDEERRRHRAFLLHFYEKRFLAAVAEGRELDRDEADRLGRGRVWTGRQAHERGLVDRLGGLEEAIQIACERANVPREEVRVSFFAPKRRLRDVLPRLAIEARVPLAGHLGDAAALVEELTREDLLLVMPWLFRIR